MKITAESSLEDVAFAVCSTLESSGVKAILTGGSAATLYAPHAYQSRDVDFVIQFAEVGGRAKGAAALADLGYTERGQTYFHSVNQYTVEFPAGPLAIGDDLIKHWNTLTKGDMKLHILTPSDSVRDRLMWFYLRSTDRQSLAAAVGIAQSHAVEMETIREWSKREGFLSKFDEFARNIGWDQGT
jgi:hypothetical protein